VKGLELVAHRGYPARYPENSLAGIDAALDAGARWLEVDVQLSSDGVPVLFHDPDLDRMCGVEGAVFETPFERLRELRLKGPEVPGESRDARRIPTVEETAVRIAERTSVTTFVEIKQHSAERFGTKLGVERVLDVLYPISKAMVIISYLPEVVSYVRTAGHDRTGLILRTWEQDAEKATRELAPDFLFCNVKKLPGEGELRSVTGSPLAVYDVTDPDLALALARRGVAMVETFQIVEMLAALGRPENP
jgi:glycerophosphoryl diester phosphodiesterase